MKVKKDNQTLILKVKETLPKDVGRAIARIDPEDLKVLGLEVGEIIELEGKRKTPAKVMPCYAEERGKGIIQIDGISRENAQVGLDEKVKIHKSDYKPASKITLSPLTISSLLQRDKDTQYLGSLIAGLPVVAGDRIRATFFGSRHCDFKVLDTIPNEGVVLIGPDTLLRIETKTKPEEVSAKISYEDIGGLSNQIQRIREMIELPLRYPQVFERLGIDAPKGVLLFGPPGTGKTLIARAVANETDAYFTHISGPEVMGKFYGESEQRLRSIFEDAQAHTPAIIFIDEIDAIAPKREEMGGEKQVERRVVAQLLALMDGLESRGQIIVIAATNIPNVLDPALRRPGRFDREISIPIPDKNGRLEILQIHTRGMPLAEDVNLEKLAEITHGFVGADLEALAREAAMSALRKILPKINFEMQDIPYETLMKLEVTMDNFQEALKEVEPSAIREVFVEVPDVKWEDVGGLEDIKEELKEAVEWPLKYQDIFKKANTNPPKGILLYGVPGTGKTLLAKAVANESGVNFISIKGPELISKYVGESLPSFEKVSYLNDGKFHSTSIGELIEKAPAKKSIQTLSFNKEGIAFFNEVSDFIKHHRHTHIYKVSTKKGMSIHVTKDHSLFTIGENGIESIRTSEIVPNETYIALPGKIQPRTSNLKSFNLLEMFADSEYLRVYGATEYVRSVAKEVGYKAVTKALGKHRRKLLDDALYRQLASPISRFLEISKLSRNKYDICKINVGLNGSKIPAIIPITRTLMEALGLWVAEGDINQGVLRITTLDKVCINVFKKLAQDLRVQYGIYGKAGTLAKTVLLISTPFGMLIRKLGFKCGAFNKNVPPFIHDLDVDLIASFLRGYFSGDGHVNVAKKKAKSRYQSGNDLIDACTVSKELAHGIAMLLRYFGIIPSIRQRINRLGNTEYIVQILGLNDFKIFAEKIGFSQSSKRSKLLQNITKRKWARGNILPVTGVVYDFVKEHIRWRKNSCVDRLTLVKKLEKIDPKRDRYHSLRTVISGGIFWDKVVSVKKIKYNGFVYDLSVKDSQNFVSGFGGIFAHNSERGIREVFKKAKQTAPTILFLDEIESLVPIRGGGDSSHVTERVISQFLAEMDGIEELKGVVVLAATNRLDLIDPALLRSGRFDLLLELPVPDEKTREEIFKIHAKNKPLAKEVDLKELAKETEGKVGSDIEFICRKASMFAIREFLDEPEQRDSPLIKKKHFEEAIKLVKNQTKRSGEA